MTKLYLNNNFNAELLSFTRNTNFDENTSVAHCHINTTNLSLYDLANTTITSLKIIRDDEIIYDLEEIDAQLVILDDNLVIGEMNSIFTIRFNMERGD